MDTSEITSRAISLSLKKTARFAVLDAPGVEIVKPILENHNVSRAVAADKRSISAHLPDEIFEDESSLHDLHVACRTGNMDHVQYLVEVVRKDINEVDAHNSPPLYYAALCGHQDVCQYLLDKGAICSEDAQDSARIYYAALNDDLRRMLQKYHLSRASVQPFFEMLRRVFNDPEFADVEIELSNQVVYLHSSMIHARCQNLSEQLSNTKRIQFCSSATASLLVLEYLYTGRFETQKEHILRNAVGISRELGLIALEVELEKSLAGYEGGKRRILVSHQEQLHADMAAFASTVVNRSQGKAPVERNVGLSASLLGTSDVTLRSATGECFFVHKYILCCHSDYFRGALLGSFAEAQDNVITLADASSKAVAATCEWMYCDKWLETPDAELCVELLDVSSHLLLFRMAALVSTVLSPYVNEYNVFDLLKLSQLHQLQKLEDTCVRVLALRIEEIMNLEEGRQGFMDLIKQEVAVTSQQGVETDLPLIADIRQNLTDQYSYLSDDDDDVVDNGRVTTLEENTITADFHNGCSLRQERRNKLHLLDSIVKDSLSVV